MYSGYLIVETNSEHPGLVRIRDADSPPPVPDAGHRSGPRVRYAARFDDLSAAHMHTHARLRHRQVDPEAGLGKLGCAAAPSLETGAAFQPFERGSMIWREDLRRIYVLQEDGTWVSYEDTWNPELREPNLIPPQALYRPMRGFARVWILELKGPPSPIGWGTAPERGYAARIQPFTRGLLFSGAGGEVYALYDDGTWEQP